MNQIALVLLVCSGIIGVATGRLLLKRWFNHLSIYSGIWAITLGLYAIRLIQYNPIIPEAWFFIALAWLTLYLGSATVVCARAAIHPASNYTRISGKTDVNPQRGFYVSTKFLARAIIILSMIAVLSLIHQWITVIRYFGGFGAVITNANQLYHLRVAGELQGGIPYLGAFALAASSLAGIYTAVRERLTLVGILPLALVGLQAVGVMGRAGIMVAGILFLTTFLYTPHLKLLKVEKMKALIGLILAGAIVVGAFSFISSTRGLRIMFEHESPTMETLRSYIPFLPSLYFYLSGPPVVFSEYLKAGGEEVYPGTNTFAPFFRLMAKFGITERVPEYQEGYFTPEPMNTGTYLREIHADFGPMGILIFPYILGVILTIITIRASHYPSLVNIVLLSHFYVIIALSFSVNAMRLGYWVISFIVSIVTSSIVGCRTAAPLLRPRTTSYCVARWEGK